MQKVNVFRKGKLCLYCASLTHERERIETYFDIPSRISISAAASIPALFYLIKQWLSEDEVDITPYDYVSVRYFANNGCFLDFGSIRR